MRGRQIGGWTALLTAAAVAGSCGGGSDPTGPAGPAEPPVRIDFSPSSAEIGEERSLLARVRNAGDVDVGPVVFVTGPVRDGGGNVIPGAGLAVSPGELPTLPAGATRSVTATLQLGADLPGGAYTVELGAQVQDRREATLGIRFTVAAAPASGDLRRLAIVGAPTAVRQGEVETLEVEAEDRSGAPVADPGASWSVSPAGAALLTADGTLVGYTPGSIRVTVRADGLADSVDITVTDRGAPSGSFSVVGHGAVRDRYTSDHWEHGDAAFTGTWSCRNEGGGTACGDILYAWDISGAEPIRTDSVRVDARVVNDVKVRPAGDLAVITHEGSSDGLNGVTLLDLADPRHPEVIGRFTDPALTPGIHNVWIEGDFVYMVVDGSGGLRILEISDPTTPVLLPYRFFAPSRFLHDVYVRDGLAFLSHWDAGLIILDVGHGIAGGTPGAPVEVSRIDFPDYLVHNAWYWPQSGYVFLGDEIRTPGAVKVIDVRDLGSPREVASFTRVGAAPHNFWVDETRGIAYFAWYENGVQAVDVSGRLLGELERQGRLVASTRYAGDGFCVSGGGTCTWAPQLHRGRVYASDMNSGLWVLEPGF